MKPSTSSLPQFLREMLANPPEAGDGVHLWLFRVARQLHAHLPAVEIIALLEQKVALCGRTVSRKEISDAVQSSVSSAWQPSDNKTVLVKPKAKWPTVNLELRNSIVQQNGGLVELIESSRTRIDDNERHTEEIIDRLFPGNPLLCCGKSSSNFDTKHRDAWRGELSMMSLIVPSPMSALTGLTKEGRHSKHALNNTGVRRFLICEFDAGGVDEHAAILLHLGIFAPLVCVVHSGNKSLHGWFYVSNQPDEKIEKFFGMRSLWGLTERRGRVRNLYACRTVHVIMGIGRRYFS
ncbi:MAG: hypothetical protein WDM76_16810 [Limisphaerales bacterium]